MDYVTSFAKAASITAIGAAALLFTAFGDESPKPARLTPFTSTEPVDEAVYQSVLSRLKPDWRYATDIEECQALHLSRLEQERIRRFNAQGDRNNPSGEDIAKGILILLACEQNPSLR